MKKRFLALFLALALCVGLAAPAFAAVDKTTIDDSSIFDPGTYTLEWQGAENAPGAFAAEEITFDSDSNPPKFKGYYAIQEDAAWTVSNTASDDTNLMIAFRERHKEGNHYSTSKNICWVLPDGTFSLSLKSAGDTDFFLKPGAAVSFSFKDAMAAMDAVANPDNLYEIEVTVRGDIGDSYLFKPASAEVSAFTDVPANAWYAAPVAWAVKNKITDGTTATTFSPNDDCTHAHILTFLWRAKGEPKNNTKVPIELTGDEWYADAVRWAASRKMIDESFDPNAKCTRAQAVNYIWQATGGGTVWEKASFTDVPADAPYAKAVDWAVYDGITAGETATTFAPDKVCTRAHIVTFLYRTYNN